VKTKSVKQLFIEEILKGRQGLIPKMITDKRGFKRKVWVRPQDVGEAPSSRDVGPTIELKSPKAVLTDDVTKNVQKVLGSIVNDVNTGKGSHMYAKFRDLRTKLGKIVLTATASGHHELSDHASTMLDIVKKIHETKGWEDKNALIQDMLQTSQPMKTPAAPPAAPIEPVKPVQPITSQKQEASIRLAETNRPAGMTKEDLHRLYSPTTIEAIGYIIAGSGQGIGPVSGEGFIPDKWRGKLWYKNGVARIYNPDQTFTNIQNEVNNVLDWAKNYFVNEHALVHELSEELPNKIISVTGQMYDADGNKIPFRVTNKEIVFSSSYVKDTPIKDIKAALQTALLEKIPPEPEPTKILDDIEEFNPPNPTQREKSLIRNIEHWKNEILDYDAMLTGQEPKRKYDPLLEDYVDLTDDKIKDRIYNLKAVIKDTIKQHKSERPRFFLDEQGNAITY